MAALSSTNSTRNGTPARAACRPIAIRAIRNVLHQQQIDGKGAAARRAFALYRHGPTMHFGQAVDRGKSQG